MNSKTGLEAQVTGEDGNVFNLAGIVADVLRRNGFPEYAKEVSKRLWACNSYEEALKMMGEYVDLV